MKKRSFSLLMSLCLAVTILVPSTCVVHADAASRPNEYAKMSDSYKSGPYYKKLMAVTLTGDQVTDLVNVAYSQVGYHAGGSSSDLSGTSTASGRYVEYFNLISPSTQNKDWCATFVSWCFREANIPTSVMPSGTGCGKLRNSVKNNGATWHAVDSGYWPKRGDLVLYEAMDSTYTYYTPASRDSSGLPTLTSHVGIVVTDYDGSTCDTVQRRSTQVKVEPINNLYSGGRMQDGTIINRIQGFVSPNYKPHEHSANYGKGYCDVCKTWLPNQNNNAYVETGWYEVVEDNPDGNIFVDHPYSIATQYGTLYGIPGKGEKVEVTGAVVNGGGNIWYKVRWNGYDGYMYSIRLTPSSEPVHIHTLSSVSAQEPTCTEVGHVAYWTCSECGLIFSDAEGKSEIALSALQISALGHDYEDGVCSRCGADDPDYTEPLHAHVLSSIPAKEPTCTEAGQIASWTCDECGLIFSDAEGEQETSLSALRIPSLGHDYEEGICTRCGVEDPDYTEPESDPDNPFVDVPDGAYYCDPVLWAYYAEPQITDGMDDTHFGPSQTVTRGQAVTFLWRSMGKPAPKSAYCPFTDVNTSDYYYQPVLWALEQGVTDGTSATTFSPGATLSRAHIITFLWRTTGRPDATGTGQWYDDAVNWARSGGFLDGTGTAFTPNGNCPRSDVVTYLYRADQEGDLNPASPAYDFVLDNCTWTQAYQRAKAAGGHLVRIETSAEYDTIRSEISQRGLDYVMFRVGARRDENKTDFYWVNDKNKPTGQPLNSTLEQIGAQWGAGEPSLQWNGTEEIVLEFQYSSGMWVWNDIADQPNLAPNYHYGYIIEY